MDRVSDIETARLFAAGAYGAAVEHGMQGDAAAGFAVGVLKEAASRRRPSWDDDDDDEDTFWGRNKHWLLPTLVGAGAFWLGANSERTGRPDRSYLSNAGSNIMNRVKKLVGVIDDPVYRSTVDVDESFGKQLKAITEGK